ncbi:MAG TPA: hypothetical protein LFW14_06325 [Rickettsia endosymbiont of Degeeriella rufa]|nr:hypothetical protein [Rickettsia endosymbiont of Degeeriella rufa]
MNLIFNPPTTSKSEINISYDAICRTQEYFSNKKLVDNPEINDEIINYYLKSFEAISEKQYFNSIKENTGTVLNGADKKTLDFIINDRKPKIKPTITFQKNNKLHEIYCDKAILYFQGAMLLGSKDACAYLNAFYNKNHLGIDN